MVLRESRATAAKWLQPNGLRPCMVFACDCRPAGMALKSMTFAQEQRKHRGIPQWPVRFCFVSWGIVARFRGILASIANCILRSTAERRWHATWPCMGHGGAAVKTYANVPDSGQGVATCARAAARARRGRWHAKGVPDHFLQCERSGLRCNLCAGMAYAGMSLPALAYSDA